jgi:pimeloyl-[acyl-carrier protein] methyl ester esterase
MKLRLAQNNLLLLPGIDGTGELFSSFTNALPPEFTSYMVAYPPDRIVDYGNLVPAIREIMPWGNPYTIVAESFAGPLALQFAAAQPDNVRAIILVCSFASNPLSPLVRWFASFLNAGWLKKRPSDKVLRKFFLGMDATQALVDQVGTALQTVKPAVLANRVKMVLDCDARQPLKACRKPIFYLLGKRDVLVGKRGWAEIKRTRLDAQCTVLDGPHMLLQAKPREAALAVVDIVNNLEDQFTESRIAPGSTPAPAHQAA